MGIETRKMTCIICPRGCRLTVTADENGDMSSCEGNFCARGANYAKAELKMPVRTLTTTVKTDSETVPMLPVKTDKPIHKDLLFEAMRLAAALKVSVPVKVGQVICRDFVQDGVNLIAGREIEK